ncbi:MAG: type II toxin-antitoxin system RatA family toxin [Myxococcaceae bacterium]
MPGATKSITINAPAEKCFAVITDYGSYSQFLPELKTVKVLERKPTEAKVSYDVDFQIKRVKYTLHHREEGPNKMTWTFIEGDVMKDNRGGWTLEDAGGGQTRATYSVEVTLGGLIPVPKALVNTLVEGSMPKMLEAFKKRIESTP